MTDNEKPSWWTVWQDGLPVAGAGRWDDGKQYAAIYAQDGPVEVREGRSKRGRLRIRINVPMENDG